MKKYLLNPPGLFAAGLLLGVGSRLLDIYTENLGNMFSQFAIWILLGVLISIYSETPKKAARNILPFCIGMLITYYVTAALTEGVYSGTFIIGWTVFALCSPLFASLTWRAKGSGVLPKIISVGIILVSVLSSIILFDGFRVYDAIITILLVYFLLIKRIERKSAYADGRRK